PVKSRNWPLKNSSKNPLLETRHVKGNRAVRAAAGGTLRRRAWSERASSFRAVAQPKSAWSIDFCHDFRQLCRRARQGQGIASAFGTPVHWGCNDSVVADYRRIPSGSRGGGRAGARLGAHLWRGGGERAPAPPRGARGGGPPARPARVRKNPSRRTLAHPGRRRAGLPPAGGRWRAPPYSWSTETKAPAAGSWHAPLTPQQAGAGCGPITREIKVRPDKPGGPGPAAGSTWPLRNTWNRATENLFSA